MIELVGTAATMGQAVRCLGIDAPRPRSAPLPAASRLPSAACCAVFLSVRTIGTSYRKRLTVDVSATWFVIVGNRGGTGLERLSREALSFLPLHRADQQRGVSDRRLRSSRVRAAFPQSEIRISATSPFLSRRCASSISTLRKSTPPKMLSKAQPTTSER